MPDAGSFILDMDALNDLESKRQRYVQFYTMLIPMGFAASCAVCAINMNKDQPFPWMIVLIITLVIAVIGFQLLNGLYRSRTKKAFLKSIAESLGLAYHPRGAFALDDFNQHGLLPPFDRAQVEDGFIGAVHGVDVAFQEVNLVDVVPSTDRVNNQPDREETVFWGLFIKIRIGKMLDAHTVVLPRNRFEAFFRTVFSKFEKINLVSPQFEDRFNALGTDQVEARYVLDPAFIECFLDASNAAGTKWVQASFRNNEIAMAIQRNKPLFEIGWLFKKLNPAAVKGVTDELQAVINLIEALKLNPHTGLGAALPGKSS